MNCVQQNNCHKTTPRPSRDTLNYIAILELERIGESEPTQAQIDLMEAILRISVKKYPTLHSIYLTI